MGVMTETQTSIISPNASPPANPIHAGVIALFPTMYSVRQWESTSHNVSLASGQHQWGWQEQYLRQNGDEARRLSTV